MFSLSGICNDLQINFQDLFFHFNPHAPQIVAFTPSPAVSPCLGPTQIHCSGPRHILRKSIRCKQSWASPGDIAWEYARICRLAVAFWALSTKAMKPEAKAANCFQNEDWTRASQSWRKLWLHHSGRNLLTHALSFLDSVSSYFRP